MHPHPRVGVSSAHPERSAGSLITTAACTLWGPDWQGSSVVLHCDNMGSVVVVNSGYSKVPQIMHLLRCLFFIRAHFSLSVRVVHVLGVENGWGDAISHNLLSGLFAQAPGGHQQVPTHSTQVAGPTHGTTAGLDLHSLDTAVQALFSTGGTYRSCSSLSRDSNGSTRPQPLDKIIHYPSDIEGSLGSVG